MQTLSNGIRVKSASFTQWVIHTAAAVPCIAQARGIYAYGVSELWKQSGLVPICLKTVTFFSIQGVTQSAR
jgi:hypothetical protein